MGKAHALAPTQPQPHGHDAWAILSRTEMASHSSNPPAQDREISLVLLVCMLDASVTRKTASHRVRHTILYAMFHAYVCRVYSCPTPLRSAPSSTR